MTGQKASYATLHNIALGRWRAIDHGFIRFNSGTLVRQRTHEDLTTVNVYFLNMEGTWGIQFFNYEDSISVNDQGGGVLIVPWALKIGGGPISWSVVD
jgi:hypothetical protein